MSLRLPSWLQAGSHPAEDDRLAQSALWTPGGTSDLRRRSGVVPNPGASLAVAAQGTPDMSVTVEAGTALVQGTNSILQGAYTVTNDAAVTVNIPASDPTNPRIDIICITVEDAYYSGANNDAILQVVTGTPAASPSAPATPANSIVLAEVTVGAGVTSITNANIADNRVFTVAGGGIIPAKSTARPSAPHAGMTIYETDTGRLSSYSEIDAEWLPTMLTWSDYSIAWTAATTNPAIGNGSLAARYIQQGKLVTVKFRLVMGTTTTYGSGNWRLSLPVSQIMNELGGAASGQGLVKARVNSVNYVFETTPSDADNFQFTYAATSNSSAIVDGASPTAWASGDYVRGVLTYEAA